MSRQCSAAVPAAFAGKMPALRACRLCTYFPDTTLVGTSIVWFSLRGFQGVNAFWAVISVVVVSEARFDGALAAFNNRVLKTVVGCVVALVFLELFGFGIWSILIAMSTSVVVGAYLISAHVAWKIAPVSVAIVLIPGMAERSHSIALHAALWRTGETLYGSGVAVGVAWVITEIGRHYGLHRGRPDLRSGQNANEVVERVPGKDTSKPAS